MITDVETVQRDVEREVSNHPVLRQADLRRLPLAQMHRALPSRQMRQQCPQEDDDQRPVEHPHAHPPHLPLQHIRHTAHSQNRPQPREPPRAIHLAEHKLRALRLLHHRRQSHHHDDRHIDHACQPLQHSVSYYYIYVCIEVSVGKVTAFSRNQSHHPHISPHQ